MRRWEEEKVDTGGVGEEEGEKGRLKVKVKVGVEGKGEFGNGGN